MFDVVALGEMLIDFTPMKSVSAENPCFEMNPGGAPANCLAAIAAFGGSSAFIGKLGQDSFGVFLKGKLLDAHINADGVVLTDQVHTTLTFVHLDQNGERSFSFLRNPGADIMLNKDEIDLSIIDNARILHFGSLSLTHEPVRSATLFALQYAKEKSIILSYDPNYRKMLWASEAEAVRWMKKGLGFADIVKMSEEEMSLITGVRVDEVEKGAQLIYEMGKKVVFITLGKDGAYFIGEGKRGFVPGYTVDAVDTTGCGDAFTGSILYLLYRHPQMDIQEKVQIACAAGALCATKKGGFPAMPTYQSAFDLVHSSNLV